MEQIKELSASLGREFEPERIILFGSHACGEATKDSDVDLLVILPFEGKAVHQAVRMRMAVRPPFPLDLIVRTPEQVRERLELGDDFIRHILEERQIVYEADQCLLPW